MEFLVGGLCFELYSHNYGKWSAIGLRPTMEDADCVVQDLHIGADPVSYYGIFDGHGGSECSRFLSENLHLVLQKHLQGRSSLPEWPPLIQQAFSECDEAFRSSHAELSKHVGAACLVCLIRATDVVVANTGDCRAVLSRRGEAIQLSNDHKPDLPSERRRIESCGGTVSHGRVNGKINLSRAFGDFNLKESGVVVCTPEVDTYQINRNIDEFVVIGCDGLFEAYSNQEIVRNVREKMRRMRATEQDPCRVVKDIVTEAVYTRRTGDNVSAILISLCAGIV